jgi:hypothetical protein
VATSRAAICEPAARGSVNWSLSTRSASRVISLATSAWRSRTTVAASTEVSVACSSRRMSRASLSSSRRCSRSETRSEILCNFEISNAAGRRPVRQRTGDPPDQERELSSSLCPRGQLPSPVPCARPPSHDPEAWPPACRSRRQLLGPSDRPRPSLARRRCRDTRFRRPLDFRARKGPHASPTRSQVTHGAAPDRS